VAVIQIPAAADSATDAKARAQAHRVRQRIEAGDKFAKVAAELSDDPGSARAGGDLGFFGRGQMDPAFEDAAFSQKIGVVGPPVRSQFGYHLIEVIERDTTKNEAGRDSLDSQGRPVVEVHARHILVKVDVTEADVERARKKAERVRAEAAKGADFAQLAARYSEYQGPQSAGGDLGFLSLGTLQPQIRAGLDSLQVGEISQVLVNRAGFNVFKLLDRKPERPYTLEEIRAELPQAVAQIQFREKYDSWVKTLRSKAHIEYRT
jgi:peptidyl-prolyl cis-trans isomerase SurA